MSSPEDGRAAAHLGHDVVVTGPGIDTRRRWTYFAVGALVFTLVVFGLARWGAEHGNEVRFGFPDKVTGLSLTMPDRAPEARGRDIVAHYDKTGDGMATAVVEWLPATKVAEALDGRASDDKVSCLEAAEVVCATRIKDGTLRVSQRSSDERSVRDFLAEFLAERIKPDRRG